MACLEGLFHSQQIEERCNPIESVGAGGAGFAERCLQSGGLLRCCHFCCRVLPKAPSPSVDGPEAESAPSVIAAAHQQPFRCIALFAVIYFKVQSNLFYICAPTHPARKVTLPEKQHNAAIQTRLIFKSRQSFFN